MNTATPTKLLRYQRVAEVLRIEICRDYEPGDKLPAESRLKERFGVGLGTLREALGQLEKEGLITRRHGSGTYVLDPLLSAAKNQPWVAVLCDHDCSREADGSFFLHGPYLLWEFFRRHGYSARIYLGHGRHDSQFDGIFARELERDMEDGLLRGVVSLADTGRAGTPRFFEERNIPFVGFGSRNRRHPFTVEYGNEEGIRQIVRFFHQRERRRLAYLSWREESLVPVRTVANQSLIDVLREECDRHGMEVRNNWISRYQGSSITGAGWEVFRDTWNSSADKPDCVYFNHHLLFRDAMVSILEMGIRVPDDLMVATRTPVNDQFFAPFPVALMEHNLVATADALGSLLIERMCGAVVGPSARFVPLQLRLFEGLPKQGAEQVKADY